MRGLCFSFSRKDAMFSAPLGGAANLGTPSDYMGQRSKKTCERRAPAQGRIWLSGLVLDFLLAVECNTSFGARTKQGHQPADHLLKRP